MSFWRTYYHIVWTTKNRQPSITAEIEPRLFAYLVHKAAEQGAYIYAINGWTDHVHLIVAIPPSVSISEFVKNLKGSSSHDLNASARSDISFAWQRGYGVLTLGERQRKDAEAYVKAQKTHHAQQSTNSWLELCEEDDAGPPDSGIKTGKVPALVQEEAGRYDVEVDGPPF